MKKAALLREQHGIPKTVLPPAECYGFQKEWETMQELEKLEDDHSNLGLQYLLVLERISTEIGLDLFPERIEFCEYSLII